MRGRRVAIAMSSILALQLLAGCALAGGTLGGREKCWPESDHRAPSLWRGILEIDTSGGRLNTSEGEVIQLLPGTLRIQVGDAGSVSSSAERRLSPGRAMT